MTSTSSYGLVELRALGRLLFVLWVLISSLPAGASGASAEDVPEGSRLEMIWEQGGFSGVEVRHAVEAGRLVAYVSTADRGVYKFDLEGLRALPEGASLPPRIGFPLLGHYQSPTGPQPDRLLALGEGVVAVPYQHLVGATFWIGGGFELIRRDPVAGLMLPYALPIDDGGGCHDISVFKWRLYGRERLILGCMAQAAGYDVAIDFWDISDPEAPYMAVRWTDLVTYGCLTSTNCPVTLDERPAGCLTPFVIAQNKRQEALGQPTILCFGVFDNKKSFRPHWLTPLTGNRLLHSGYDSLSITHIPDLSEPPNMALEVLTSAHPYNVVHAHDAHLRGNHLVISDEVGAKVSMLTLQGNHLLPRGHYWPPGEFPVLFNHYGAFVPEKDIDGKGVAFGKSWFVSTWMTGGIAIIDVASAPNDDDGIVESRRTAVTGASQGTTWGNTVAWLRLPGIASTSADPIVIGNTLYLLVADAARGLTVYRYCPAC